MDRSFLSQSQVIAASRGFVCIRVPSYEDAAEMRFCRDLFIGRSGDAENTTFAVLSPDGKKTLSRASRGTRGLYSDAGDMSRKLTAIAAQYPETKQAQALPVAADARLGLTIAAADGLPLVVVLSEKPAAREALLAELSWRDEFIGRFTYAVAASAKECQGIDGIGAGEGVLFIKPDNFGRRGQVRHRVEAVSAERLAEAMRTTLAAHKKTTKDMRDHRVGGIENGVFYVPKLPVTDLQEAGARERTKRAIERRDKEGKK